jgi:hypothetical protein
MFFSVLHTQQFGLEDQRGQTWLQSVQQPFITVMAARRLSVRHFVIGPVLDGVVGSALR